MSSAAPVAEQKKDAATEVTPPTPATVKAAAEQFDKEFQKYTTKLPGKSARAVALARAELAKATAVLWQDKKLEQAKVKEGRLSAEQRAMYEKRVRDLERAIDDFHKAVAGYNVNKAVMSVALLLLFAFAFYFQPWRKWFEFGDDSGASDRDL